ncbi:MAG: hypothetical protein RDV41_12555 [Planctomycetota bacterium]|nr:hypothetical protein [Planctomycetota bacterium]
MVKEWLQNKTTVEECEKNYLVKDERLGPNPVPFGFQNQKWLELKQRMQEGDELWEYCSPPETWKAFCGRAGVCVVRNGEVIDSISTMMN